MNIVDQGTWSPYTPDPYPANLPHNTAFAKRDSDGLDWYAAIYGQTPLFANDSVKATVWKLPNATWMVQAVDTDVTKMFPSGCRIIEIVGYTGADAFADFHGQQYDPATNTLSPFK